LVTNIDTAAGRINSPTDSTIVSIREILKVYRHLLTFAQAQPGSKIDDNIAGNRPKERSLGNTMSKNAILNFSERFSGRQQNVVGCAKPSIRPLPDQPSCGHSIQKKARNA
jgi:hypothetical protein